MNRDHHTYSQIITNSLSQPAWVVTRAVEVDKFNASAERRARQAIFRLPLLQQERLPPYLKRASRPPGWLAGIAYQLNVG